jgi:hypothetical protein
MAIARGRTNGLQSLADAAKIPYASAAPPGPPYRCVLLKQNCIGEEKYNKGGRSCMAKVVVKKSPFLLQFALEPLDPDQADSVPDLHSFTFDAKLVYEYDESKVRFLHRLSLLTGCRKLIL